MKKFWADFKKFITKGNILDMAVGVIIGSAFSKIVTSLTNQVVMPFINWLLSLGGENGLENAYTFLKKVEVDGVVDLTKSIYIDWGAFITAIIDFILIAFVLFTVIRVVMKTSEMLRNSIEASTNKQLKKERKEVKKLAKAQGRSFREVWEEHVAEKERIAKEKAEVEAKLNHKPSQEELLTQIRDLLMVNGQSNEENTKSTSTKHKKSK